MARLSKSGFKIINTRINKPNEAEKSDKSSGKKPVSNVSGDKKVKQSFAKIPAKPTNKTKNIKNTKSDKNIQTLGKLFTYMNDFKVILKLFMTEDMQQHSKVVYSNVFVKLNYLEDSDKSKNYFLKVMIPSNDSDSKLLASELKTLSESLFNEHIQSFQIMSDTNIIFNTKHHKIAVEPLISIKRLSPMSAFDKGFK